MTGARPGTAPARLALRAGDLEPARERLDAFLDAHAPPERVRYVAHLVLEECMTNLLMHAFPGDASHPIDASIERDAQGFVFRLADDGPPFDPTVGADPTPPRTIEEARIGGLGLMLVRRMARSVEYRRDGTVNRLTVRFAT